MAGKLLPYLKEGDASLGRSAAFTYSVGLTFQSLVTQRYLLAIVGNASSAESLKKKTFTKTFSLIPFHRNCFVHLLCANLCI